jgi:hypothetical protein
VELMGCQAGTSLGLLREEGLSLTRLSKLRDRSASRASRLSLAAWMAFLTMAGYLVFCLLVTGDFALEFFILFFSPACPERRPSKLRCSRLS